MGRSLYQSRTKVIDGQENPIHIVYANALWEVQKYVNLTGHFYTPYIFAASKKSLDKLPPDLQKIVKDTAQDMAAFERNIIKSETGKQTEELKKKGMEIVTVDRKIVPNCFTAGI